MITIASPLSASINNIYILINASESHAFCGNDLYLKRKVFLKVVKKEIPVHKGGHQSHLSDYGTLSVLLFLIENHEI